MTYLLILVLLVVAISPLLSMMPTRRQRHLAGLRQAAATSGLYVKLESGDDGERVFYGCRRQRGDTTQSPALVSRQPGGWSLERGNWPAERLELLAELPQAVMQVREDREGLGVFWTEEGTTEEVHQIALVLRKLLGRHW